MTRRPTGRPISFVRRAVCVALALSLPAIVHAQANGPQPIHWAYSAYFGTGVYETSAGAEAIVASLR